MPIAKEDGVVLKEFAQMIDGVDHAVNVVQCIVYHVLSWAA